MPGLFWLLQGSRPRGLPAGCMTFVRGTDERLVLAGLGVDPDDAIRPDDPEFSSTPGITIVRSGDWLVALETAAWPRGIRPDVLLRLSAGTEAVVVFEDIGKLNHEFAHAVDGEVITAVTTCVPPSWGGTQPDRLRPLAEELGVGHQDGSPGSDDYDLGDLEILLLIAETALGLSLDEADLNRPLLKVPDQPADPTPARGQTPRPPPWSAQHTCAPMCKGCSTAASPATPSPRKPDPHCQPTQSTSCSARPTSGSRSRSRSRYSPSRYHPTRDPSLTEARRALPGLGHQAKTAEPRTSD
jgi:hypothetical protein